MADARLSALDDSFLAVESPSAHMHVGWAAAFAPPSPGSAPRFAELRDHIEARLPRAPRYRQMLAPVPLGLNSPTWVDDVSFDVGRHVIASGAGRLDELVDECMSTQLPRDRPLWQICVADRLDDGRIGVVGKAHHCMVDGLAAVGLATLLLDPSPNPDPAEPDGWRAKPAAGWVWRLAEGLGDRLREQATLLQLPARVVRSPARLPAQARAVGLALVRAVRPAKPVYPLNQPISPARHLASFWRPFEDLKRIGREFGVTVNDVLLAISTGGIRRWLQDRGRGAEPLKAMVPVSVRPDGAAEELGNRISFVFVDLPCDEPDAVRRLTEVRAAMSERKRSGDPEGAQAVLEAVKLAPRSVRRTVSRLVASPRTFNLVVSNIPGPREPMYMLGCELQEAYPVVPIADEHALSIGMTTVGERACFGLYTDRESLPDSDRLAAEMEAAIDELLTRA